MDAYHKPPDPSALGDFLFQLMSTSRLQRYTSQKLSTHFGGYTIRENIRPDWLINESGNRLEIDFLIEELHVGIEVQGSQHYEYSEFFHGSWDNYQKRLEWDLIKTKRCSERGIRLLEVSNEDEVDDAVFQIYQVEAVLSEQLESIPWVTTPSGNAQIPPRKSKGTSRDRSQVMTKKQFLAVANMWHKREMSQYTRHLSLIRKCLTKPVDKQKSNNMTHGDLIKKWREQEGQILAKMEKKTRKFDSNIDALYIAYINGEITFNGKIHSLLTQYRIVPTNQRDS